VKAIILGSGAGGGVPQWNCRCAICEMARAGDPRVLPRTQSSLAVSLDERQWLLINASPDIRQQIAGADELFPHEAARHSPIAAVLLTNGDVDHIAGLLSLRESQAFSLYATAQTLRAVDANRVFSVVNPAFVTRRAIDLHHPFEALPGLSVELFSVPGKVPLWLEDENLRIGEAGEHTVGVEIKADGQRLLYVPGCAAIDDKVRKRLDGADMLLFDGTLWTDEEMIAAGVGVKTGRRMGHVPVSSGDGAIAALAGLAIGRRIFVHINNTNPILIDGSPERRQAEAAGWEIGFDGMRMSL